MYKPQTEQEVEDRLEKLTDIIDSKYMENLLTKETYEFACEMLNEWANKRIAEIRLANKGGNHA